MTGVLRRYSGWAPFPFAASTSDFGTGYQPCSFWKDQQGMVHVRGQLAFSGTPTNGQLVGTLPAGFRPAAKEQFVCNGSYSAGNIAFVVEVATTGTVNVFSVSGVTWTGSGLSLSGIRFATT